MMIIDILLKKSNI